MPMYLGPDGQIYNRPVSGATRIDTGTVTPPRPQDGYTPYPTPRRNEAGFLRKSLFWLTALGGSLGMAYAMSNILCNQVFAGTSLDGIVGAVSNGLGSATPVIMIVLAVIACFVCGVGAGGDNNYNLVGWVLTLLATGGICLGGAVALVLLPYGLALIGYLFLGALIIGLIASFFGG